MKLRRGDPTVPRLIWAGLLLAVLWGGDELPGLRSLYLLPLWARLLIYAVFLGSTVQLAIFRVTAHLTLWRMTCYVVAWCSTIMAVPCLRREGPDGTVGIVLVVAAVGFVVRFVKTKGSSRATWVAAHIPRVVAIVVLAAWLKYKLPGLVVVGPLFIMIYVLWLARSYGRQQEQRIPESETGADRG
jgi:hypothetical protein